MMIQEAQKLFGQDCITPSDVEKVFGTEVKTTQELLFRDEVLHRAKKLKYRLIFHHEGEYSISQLYDLFKIRHGKAFCILPPRSIEGALELTKNPLEFNVKPVFREDRTSFDKIICEHVRPGWFLVSPCIQPGIEQSYFTQILYAYEHLWDSFFRKIKTPKHIKDAFDEYRICILGIMHDMVFKSD